MILAFPAFERGSVLAAQDITVPWNQSSRARAGRPAAPLRVETASGREALTALGPEWDVLVDRQRLPSPLLATEWLRGMRAGDPDATIVLARRGGELVAGGAFRRTRIGPATVGTWLAGARLPAVLAAEDEPAASREVVAEMADRCHALWLPRVPALGPTMGAVGSAVPWRRATVVEPPGYVVRLPPSRLDHARDKAAYAVRRAGRKGAAIRVRTAADPDEIRGAFDRLAKLYRQRWRGREQEGARYSDVAHVPLRYHALLPVIAAAGRVRIVEVYEGAELVASLLGLLCGRGALFHTTATRPDGALRGPGHVAMLAWVEEAAAAGAEIMYLGRGAGQPEGPKARIGAEALPLFDVLAAPSPRRQSLLTMVLRARGVLARSPRGSGP